MIRLPAIEVPFEIDWHVAMNFRMIGEDGFLVTADEENDLVIDFKLNSWFDGIDFADAEKDDEGTIRINKNQNHKFMKVIHSNIRASIGFGKDANRDGKISQSEQGGKGEAEDDESISE